MQIADTTPLKFCFISNNGQSNLTEYIDLSPYDLIKNFTFKKLNFSALKVYNPHIVVVDQYFTDKDFSALIYSLKINFKNVKLYILSPKFDRTKELIRSENCKNHYFSCFSNVILSHINSTIKKIGNKKVS